MEPVLNDMDDYKKPLSTKKLWSIITSLAILSSIYVGLVVYFEV